MNINKVNIERARKIALADKELDKVLHLTEEQEYDLWMATSALSRLAKETK